MLNLKTLISKFPQKNRNLYKEGNLILSEYFIIELKEDYSEITENTIPADSIPNVIASAKNILSAVFEKAEKVGEDEFHLDSNSFIKINPKFLKVLKAKTSYLTFGSKEKNVCYSSIICE